MAARTPGPTCNGVSIDSQQLHFRIERADLFGELHDFEVGEPVVQQQGLGWPPLQLSDRLGAAAGLAHIPAQAAQAVPQPLPQRCVRAGQYHASIECDVCRCHVCRCHVTSVCSTNCMRPLRMRLFFDFEQPLPHMRDDVGTCGASLRVLP